MGGVGGMQMRLNGSRFRRSSALAVVGGCLAVYIVLAVGFHWFVEPTLGKNQAVSAYDPSPARIVPLSGPPAVAPASAETASASLLEPRGANQSQSAGPGGHGGVPSSPAAARRTPADDAHLHEAGAHRDRPLGATVARRAPAD